MVLIGTEKRSAKRVAIGVAIAIAISIWMTTSTTGCALIDGAPPPDEERVAAQSEELTRKCGTGPTVPGLDIAVFEGNVDFAKVRASGQRWVIARTNDGTYVDTRFISYYRAAKAAGLIVGAYMFYRVGLEHDRPGTQVNIMLDLLNRAGYEPDKDLPPTLDVEGGSFNRALGAATIVREMKPVLDKLEARAGRKPIIYTNAAWEEYIGQSTFGAYPLWAAQYFNNGSAASNCPSVAATGARTWTFWQHCKGEGGAGQCQRDVPGVPEQRPDQNVFNGTIAELMAFARGGRPASSPPPPPPADGGAAPPTIDGCHSETLGRDVAENTCVQSGIDNEWYQCSNGEWLERTTVAAACTAEHPL